ncbi:hypothetical protein KIN20_014464 [Parelaphostrongylus tenuis]|uniref:Uncharacterized protein n=1 Tax=Parelaphostrongylus tenuis TaxID=148309 RepID=A0AAD5MF06_PARTN|nr:hypothetical protein KIN20_014464 [Parelaphostrongylus tenuis]
MEVMTMTMIMITITTTTTTTTTTVTMIMTVIVTVTVTVIVIVIVTMRTGTIQQPMNLKRAMIRSRKCPRQPTFVFEVCHIRQRKVTFEHFSMEYQSPLLR